MTSRPLQLAGEQLKRLAELSGGAVEVRLGPQSCGVEGYYAFEISLDVSDVQRAEGGIRLRAREQFRITIGPRYPFVPPEVTATHGRWAGAPHVQWGRTLCLYLAPALEWSPEDGMRGLIERLVSWLERAATATLDPIGEPPHPPIAYPTPEAGFAVIHADIGDVAAIDDEGLSTPTLLVGWGSGVNDRLDIDAWFSRDDFRRHVECDEMPPIVSGHGRAALCVLLCEPIAFEYPSQLADLAAGLSTAGVNGVEFFEAIKEVIVATASFQPAASPGRGAVPQSLPPIAVLIGSPSRSVDGTNRLVHLVGFSVQANVADLDRLHRFITERVESAAPDLSAPLSWLMVYEDRSEVTVRRDHDSPASALRGQDVLVLGCGALGAPIAEQCVRAGARVTVADSGRVTPGILVRQPYYDDEIGKPKAEVLAARLRAIGREPDDVHAVTGDVITRYFSNSIVPAYDLLIDATANGGVRAAIEVARGPHRADWPPVVTMLIGHAATIGVATVSETGATGGGHDVLRRLGIASLSGGPQWREIAEEFYPYPPRTKLFQPEPGCSEPTFTGSAADVTGLASSLLLAVVGVLADDASAPMQALAVRTVRTASSRSNPAAPSLDVLKWSNDLVWTDDSGRYEVRLSTAALSDMRAEVRRRSRMHPAKVETGGMLLGWVDESTASIYVDRALPPPPDSLLGTHHFEHGIEGAQEIVDHTLASSGHASGFVGMWHTHPEGQASPSDTDERGMASLVVPVSGAAGALMVILGGGATRWAAWRDGGETPVVYGRFVNSMSNTPAQRDRPPGEFVRADLRLRTIELTRKRGLRAVLPRIKSALRGLAR